MRSLEAHVYGVRDGTLALRFALEGDLARVRIPRPRPACRSDQLWQHTCFEAFIASKSQLAYHELNFAPSGEWAAYAFRSYRDGTPFEQDMDPGITVRSSEHRLELDAVIRLDRLLLLQPSAPLRLALSAVIEDEAGSLSYWALEHPPGKPDFHHRRRFRSGAGALA